MKLRTPIALLAAVICAIAFSIYGSGLAGDDSAVQAADGEFWQAAEKGNTVALSRLLDADFQWIEASGNVRGRSQVLTAVPKMIIPKPIANSEGPTSIHLYNYGQIAVMETDHGRLHVLRVWGDWPRRRSFRRAYSNLTMPHSCVRGMCRNTAILWRSLASS